MHKVRQHYTERKRILVETLSMETRAEVDDARLFEPQTAVEQGRGQAAHPNPGEVNVPNSPELDIGPYRYLWENVAKRDIQLNIFQHMGISFRRGCCPDTKTPFGKEFRVRVNLKCYKCGKSYFVFVFKEVT